MNKVLKLPILLVTSLLLTAAGLESRAAERAGGGVQESKNIPSHEFQIRLSGSRTVTVKAPIDGRPYQVKSISPLLDPSFGTGGTVMLETYDTVSALGQSVALQTNGKLVVAGYSVSNGVYSFTLARYDADGSLDSSFGAGGTVRTLFVGGVGQDKAYAVGIQKDGKIVVAGVSEINGQGSAFAVARYDTNGTPDATFGNDGTVETLVGGTGSNNAAFALSVQADGKIVVAGTSGPEIAVARYNSDGTLDSHFGKNGVMTTAIHGGDGTDDVGNSVALEPNGKIVVAGYSYSFNGGGLAFALARFDSDGAIDTTFGESGTIRSEIGGYGPSTYGQALAVQPDGRIVVTGYYYGVNVATGFTDFLTCRYNRDGSLDSTFGSNGSVLTSLNGGNNSDDGYALALQPDGKIIIAGRSGGSTGSDFAAARLDTNGAVDSTFGNNGTIRFAIDGGNGSQDEARGVVVEPDGDIVMAGYSYGSSGSAFALARCLANGTLDDTFGNSGTVRTVPSGGYGDDAGNSMAIQTDGKIVVAGTAYSGSKYEFAVVRLNKDGTLDESFGKGGFALVAINGGSMQDLGNSVAIQPDGKIVVAGVSYDPSDTAFAVVRLNSNGTLDQTFGTNGTVRATISGGNRSYDVSYAVAIQSDGKIVVAGSSKGTSGTAVAVARFNPNGTADATFGTGGSVRTAINGGDGTFDEARSVALQPDGKIVVAGDSHGSSGYALAIARYNSEGTLDYQFGDRGTVRTTSPYDTITDFYCRSVALQDDGKIVVAGNASSTSLTSSCVLARYKPDGSLDSTLGSDGILIRKLSGNTKADDGISLAIQKDGKLVVAGLSQNSSLSGLYFAAWRYDEDGRPDTTFSPTGEVTFNINGGAGTDLATSLAIQPDGKTVVAGMSLVSMVRNIAVARLLPGSVAFSSPLSPSDLSDSGSVMNGEVYPHSSATTVHFTYGTNPGALGDSANATPVTAYGDTLTAVSDFLNGLHYGSKYYYRVSGKNTTGEYFVSALDSFKTFNPVPATPLIVSPDQVKSIPRRATFVWNSPKFASYYRFQLAKDSSFSSVAFDSTVSDTTLKLNTPLAATTNYFWRVSAADSSGSSGFSRAVSFTTGTGIDAVEGNGQIPKSYALYQNYPNPFNPGTTIRFDIKEQSKVTLTIYNVLGQRVEYWDYGKMEAGRYSRGIDMAGLATGVYFYRLDAGSYSKTMKLMLLK